MKPCSWVFFVARVCLMLRFSWARWEDPLQLASFSSDAQSCTNCPAAFILSVPGEVSNTLTYKRQRPADWLGGNLLRTERVSAAAAWVFHRSSLSTRCSAEEMHEQKWSSGLEKPCCTWIFNNSLHKAKKWEDEKCVSLIKLCLQL